MPCYHPVQSFKLLNCFTEKGKSVIRFKRPSDVRDVYEEMQLPCGRCIGCKLEYSRQWAIRCLHESKLYEYGRGNCFLTLTFSDEALLKRKLQQGTDPRSLDVRDFQKFMKRLRKKFGSGIRFFHCGEYGDQYGRPHYHAIVFNLDFPDRKYCHSIRGNKYYSSKILDELWPYGIATIGEVNFKTAAYVARYVVKKVNGAGELERYALGVDDVTGEVLTRKKEYVTMSRNGGIGKEWYARFGDRVRREDSVTLNGKQVKPPKFYDSQFELLSPQEFEEVKQRRRDKADAQAADNTRERLLDKEKVAQAKLDLFSTRGDL